MFRRVFGFSAAIASILLSSPDGNASVPALAKAPAATTVAAVPMHARFPFPRAQRPSGTTVLYDQTAEFDSGVPTQDLQSANDAFDSLAADDFTVTDVNGWTVSGFNFEVAFQADGALVDAPADATYNIVVYADDARRIGAAVCTYSTLSGAYDASNTRLSVALPTSCVLPTGIYWLSLQVVADSPPQAFWLNAFFFDGILENFGNVAQWKNPGGGYGVGCADWTPLSECGDADGNLIGNGIPNYLFQVVGSVNGNGGFDCTTAGICLQLTVAPANRDVPALCGSTTSIDVEAGEQVNFCYRVTNNTSSDLPYQSLSDNVDGVLFTELDHPLAPGETWQYNRTVTIGSSETVTAGWTAQDRLANGYTATYTGADGSADRVFVDGFDGAPTNPASGFIDITSIGTPLNLFDLYSTANVTMPFPIDFYGRTSNLLCVGNSGDIQFGITGCENFPNFALPYLNVDAAIMAFWDNMDENGQIYTAVIGDAPTRRFVVEWFQKDLFFNPGPTDTVTFETILDEATGNIAFEYLDTTFGSPADDNGASATIGLQRNTSQADQYSYDEASVTDGSSIVWTRNVPTTYTGSATVQVASSAAHAVVTPSPIALTVTNGQSIDAVLSIANDGNRDLLWNLHASASNAHLPSVSAFVVPMGNPAQFSGGRAPASRSVSGATHGRGAQPAAIGYPDVPSFAIESILGNLQGFNAEQPRDWQVVGPIDADLGNDRLFTGGDFLDGDFSTLYALNYDTNGLFKVSALDGHGEFIATASGLPSSSISGLKQDPLTGIVYVSTIPPDSSGTSMLWTIDRATAATTLVGPISNSIAIIDIAFNSLGQLYGIDIATDALVAIDKTTGQGSVIGSIGFNANYASGLAFDLQTDVLYFATVEDFGGFNVVQEMWTVDTTTGAATLLGPVSTTPGEIQVDAFAIAHHPTACASTAEVPWLSWNVDSGTTAPGQASNVTVTAHSQGLAVGTHDATLCVYTNDATQRRVPVAVSLEVTP